MALEWSDDIQDHEFPESDEEDDGVDTSACPECGEQVYEDAPCCPCCGHYQIGHAATIPRWWILVVALLIILVFFVLFQAR